MDRLNSSIDSINGFVWGAPMLGMLGVTGVLLTLGLVFRPWRKLGYGFRLLFDKRDPGGAGEVKPFNALMTALSATVGTGNIAGVATAIALGGPGAIRRVSLTEYVCDERSDVRGVNAAIFFIARNDQRAIFAAPFFPRQNAMGSVPFEFVFPPAAVAGYVQHPAVFPIEH